MTNERITKGHQCENPRCDRTYERDEQINPHKRFCSAACRVEYHRERRREALARLEQQEQQQHDR